MPIISTANFHHYLATIERIALRRRIDPIRALESIVAPQYHSKLQSNLNILRLSGYDDTSICAAVDQTSDTIGTLATIKYVESLMTTISKLTSASTLNPADVPRIAFTYTRGSFNPNVQICSATLRTSRLSTADRSVGWAGYQECGMNLVPKGMSDNCPTDYYVKQASHRAAAPELHKCLDLLALWARSLGPRRECLVPADLDWLNRKNQDDFNKSYQANPVVVTTAARIVGLVLNSKSGGGTP